MVISTNIEVIYNKFLYPVPNKNLSVGLGLQTGGPEIE